MSTQSFDVSLFNKTLTWQAPGPAPAVRGRQMSADGGSSRTAQGDGFAHDAEKAVDRPRSARGLSMECTTGRGLSIECQVCTVTALVVLVCIHLLMLQNVTSLVVSVYILVLSPLTSTFYSISARAQSHLYVLNLGALIVLMVNARYKRDVSVLFFAVGSLVLLHVLCLGGWRGRENENNATETRMRALLLFFVCVNVLAAYVFSGRLDVDEYSPHMHGIQALLLVLDVLVYTLAQPR